jgi:hypothetical protein
MFKNICQSCGMQLNKDKNGGGTNADGNKSTEYCSNCFQHGKFVLSDITVGEMQQRVIGKLKEYHFPGLLAWLMTRNIPKLKRWKQN